MPGGPQLRLLTELVWRASPPATECWLVDLVSGKYALVVRTLLGDNKYKMTVAPGTVASLHGEGAITYGGTVTNLTYWRDDCKETALFATKVRATDHGRKLSRSLGKQARHRRQRAA